MHYVVKLQRDRRQYRITIPLNLIEACGLEDVELVRLEEIVGQVIVIKEYHGKRKEKRDIPEDQA